MILIADCGSTKIDWCLLNGNEKVAQIFTTGMNALMMTEEEMTATIKAELVPHISGYQIDEIYYYGAGILNEEVGSHVVNALKANIPQPLRWKWQATCLLLLAHSVAASLVSLVSWVLVLTLATTMAKRWLTTYLHSAISSATKVVVQCSASSSWATCSKSNFQNTFAKSSTTNTRLTA